MKTLKAVLIGVFFLSSIFVSAQSTERIISKDAQKFANKKSLSNEHLLQVVSIGYPTWIISKEVQLIANRLDRTPTPNNMVSTGYPFWTISKGILRTTKPIKEVAKPKIKDVIAKSNPV